MHTCMHACIYGYILYAYERKCTLHYLMSLHISFYWGKAACASTCAWMCAAFAGCKWQASDLMIGRRLVMAPSLPVMPMSASLCLALFWQQWPFRCAEQLDDVWVSSSQQQLEGKFRIIRRKQLRSANIRPGSCNACCCCCSKNCIS